MAKQGSGYLGTNKIEVSSLNQEIVPEKPSNWTIPYHLYKFSFINYQDVIVLINGDTEIFLKAGQGFEMNEIDKPITSFIIKDANVEYSYIAAY